MPPPRRIIPDPSRMLASIRQTAAEQREAALARTIHYAESQRQEALRLARWVPRDLAALAGHPLTASERKRHQEALRRLEVDGLVVLDSRHVRLTEVGEAEVIRAARALARNLTLPGGEVSARG